MTEIRKERNKHAKGANCWTVFHGMVVVKEGLTEAEADALIKARKETTIPLGFIK
ncbi:hypothetical protein VA602_03745 [Pseudomonas sp. MH2]|uniref:Uncharacterized protein n=1 Tax=Pseudomonas machongensis TaxID=3110229 RepID=A0ABU5VAQ5_9PSED|nr:hypothetical protein [Pseudomonas sp. MH2]MEA5670449.1 hypothetical protein [Pseudomonas sp. MH2]